MVKRTNIAFTAPINPPSAPFALTHAQIWQGLERKIRKAEEFVPVIDSCEVKEEYVENGVPVTKRVVGFNEGAAPALAKKNGGVLEETCFAYEPSRVDFHQPDGSRVANIISAGADGELYMTYAFELIGDDKDLSDPEQVVKAREQGGAMARGAVLKSIDSIREMVKDGRIKA